MADRFLPGIPPLVPSAEKCGRICGMKSMKKVACVTLVVSVEVTALAASLKKGKMA